MQDVKKETEKTLSKRSVEALSHFNCGTCKKWFSIGDAPTDRNSYYCPWCGEKSEFLSI